MCLFPKLIRNKKYYPTRKNGYSPPPIEDGRTALVPVGCGKCIECLKKKARDWKIRLSEELKCYKYAYFITLTFEPEELKKLCQESNLKESNAVAGLAIRRYLERWRKKYKKSQRHWLITELGQENTERIHLHGIIFSEFDIPKEEIQQIWKYGNVVIGHYCNERTINYITKYVTKLDSKHKNYVPQIFCSSGIGKAYTKRFIPQQIHQFNENNTIEFYRTKSGAKISLPIYYRNLFWNDEQREKLWIKKLDEDTRYVMGVKIKNVSTPEGERQYFRVLRKAQETNKNVGYGDDSEEWSKKEYNITQRMLRKQEKIKKYYARK